MPPGTCRPRSCATAVCRSHKPSSISREPAQWTPRSRTCWGPSAPVRRAPLWAGCAAVLAGGPGFHACPRLGRAAVRGSATRGPGLAVTLLGDAAGRRLVRPDHLDLVGRRRDNVDLHAEVVQLQGKAQAARSRSCCACERTALKRRAERRRLSLPGPARSRLSPALASSDVLILIGSVYSKRSQEFLWPFAVGLLARLDR